MSLWLKKFFTKVFWAKSFHFWKSLIYLPKSRAVSLFPPKELNYQKITLLRQTVSYDQKWEASTPRIFALFSYSKSPLAIPRSWLSPEASLPHLFLTIKLEKASNSICSTYFCYNLIFSSSRPEAMKKELLFLPHIFTMNCTVLSVSESHANLWNVV